MFALAIDVQKIIIEYLDPREIKELYETCKDAEIMFDELTKHTNFIVDCKKIISDKELKWYKANNIKLKLFEEYKKICGNQYWYKNGDFHRDNDLPAAISSSGSQIWYKNGKIHRDNNLPAIIFSNDGTQIWYKNGEKHRDNDLPAEIWSNGDQVWYKNGKYHRDNNLPAVICSNGNQYWFENGNEYDPNK